METKHQDKDVGASFLNKSNKKRQMIVNSPTQRFMMIKDWLEKWITNIITPDGGQIRQTAVIVNKPSPDFLVYYIFCLC